MLNTTDFSPSPQQNGEFYACSAENYIFCIDIFYFSDYNIKSF